MSQTLNKTELCQVFGYLSQGNRTNVRALRKHYLNDEILKHVGVDPNAFDKSKKFTFDAIQTHKLRCYFIEIFKYDILQTKIQ